MKEESNDLARWGSAVTLRSRHFVRKLAVGIKQQARERNWIFVVLLHNKSDIKMKSSLMESYLALSLNFIIIDLWLYPIS